VSGKIGRTRGGAGIGGSGVGGSGVGGSGIAPILPQRSSPAGARAQGTAGAGELMEHWLSRFRKED
jgi:hypothetical protein